MNYIEYYKRKEGTCILMMPIIVAFCFVNCLFINFFEPSILTGIYALAILLCGFMIIPFYCLFWYFGFKKDKLKRLNKKEKKYIKEK